MRTTLRLTVVALLMLGVAAFPAAAQEVLPLDEIVTGTISADVTEVGYTHEGVAGEILVMQLYETDIVDDYNRPQVTLIDPTGAEILVADGFSEVNALWEVPVDGKYTIIVGRADDASVGEYNFSITNPTPLTLGETMSGTLSSEERPIFFTFREDTDFVLDYVIDGEFKPQLAVGTIEPEFGAGRLDEVGVAAGGDLDVARIGVFNGNDPLVIAIQQGVGDLY
ncbi:MAG: hypothetical protein AAF125_25835, partial [Chloroflexota bacterium]